MYKTTKNYDVHKERMKSYMREQYNTPEGKAKSLIRYYYNKYKTNEDFIDIYNNEKDIIKKLIKIKEYHTYKKIGL